MTIFNISKAAHKLSLIFSIKEICVLIVSVECGEVEEYDVCKLKERELCQRIIFGNKRLTLVFRITCHIYHSVVRNLVRMPKLL